MAFFRDKSEIFVLISAIIYALYPAVSAISVSQTSPAVVVIHIYVSYALINMFLALCLKKSRAKIAGHWRNGTLDRQGFLSVLFDAVAHLLFLYALTIGSAVVATATFETWPFFAMLMSYRFLKEQHKFPSIFSISIGLLAVFGIYILALQPFDDFIFEIGSDLYQIIILSLIAAAVAAIAQHLHTAVSIRFGARENFEMYFVGQFFRGFHFLVLASLLVIYLLLFSEDFVIEDLFNGFAINFLIGGVIFVLVPFFYRFGIIHSSHENIFIIFFVSPIFAIFFLYFTGVDHFSTSSAVGAIVIFVSNILLSRSSVAALRYVGFLLSIPSLLIIFLLNIQIENDAYFNVVSVFSIIFVLIYGYLFNQIIRRRNDFDETVLHLQALYVSQKLNLTAFSQGLRSILADPSNDDAFEKTFSAIKAKSEESKLDLVKRKARVIDYAKNGFPIADCILIFLLGVGFCVAMIVFKDKSQIQNFTSFVIVSSIIYLVLYIFDIAHPKLIERQIQDFKDGDDPQLWSVYDRRVSFMDGFFVTYAMLMWGFALYILFFYPG